MAEKKRLEAEGKHEDPDGSHHEIVEHPNMDDVNATPVNAPTEKKEKKQGCATIMRRLDVMIIKPLLIYKYEHGTHKKQKIFNELLMMEGERLEEIFAAKNDGKEHGELRRSQLLDYLNAKNTG